MFSSNQKISPRQLQALLLTDWMGKIMLILPGFLGKMGGYSALAGLLAGSMAALAAAALIMKKTKGRETESGWGSLAQRRGGRWAAAGIYILYGLYYLCHAALMLYLCGEVAVTYLLPESNFGALTLLACLLGLYLARGGMEVRGRVSELTAFLIWGLFFIMLLFTMTAFHPEQLVLNQEPVREGKILDSALAVWLGFGGLGVLPLIREQVEGKNIGGRVIRAVLMTVCLLFLSVLAGFGIFGNQGMKRLKWPVISLMSSGSMKGIFLQRWDVLLMGFLVFALFLSVGEGIYYMGAAGRKLGIEKNWVMTVGGAGAWLLCMGMSDHPSMLEWGTRIVFLAWCPILLAAVFWMGTGRRSDIKEKSSLGKGKEGK